MRTVENGSVIGILEDSLHNYIYVNGKAVRVVILALTLRVSVNSCENSVFSCLRIVALQKPYSGL